MHSYLHMYMVVATIIERKLRSTKVRLFTVPCCSIIPFSSEGMKKKYLNLLLFFSSFYDSCLFYNCVFPHISHIYQFCSIINFRVLWINFAESPFCNSGFYVTFFRGPRKMQKMRMCVIMYIYRYAIDIISWPKINYRTEVEEYGLIIEQPEN